MPETLDQVVAKIKRLQAMAGQDASPEEAAIAAAKMQEILLRHNLSLKDVEGRGSTPIEYWELGRLTDWEAVLAGGVAEAHLSALVADSGPQWPRGYAIAAHEENLVVIKSIYAWLRETLIKMAAAELEQAQGYMDIYAHMAPVEWTSSYLQGAVDGVVTAYAAMRAKVEEEVPGSALVLKGKGIDEQLQRENPEMTSGRIEPEALGHAYRAGKADAARINLGVQIGGDDYEALGS